MADYVKSPRNAIRAHNAEGAIALYRVLVRDPQAENEQILADLICDIMHWCHFYGVEFDSALYLGEWHFLKEQHGNPETEG